VFDPTRPVDDGIAVLNLLSPSFFKTWCEKKCCAPSYVSGQERASLSR